MCVGCNPDVMKRDMPCYLYRMRCVEKSVFMGDFSTHFLFSLPVLTVSVFAAYHVRMFSETSQWKMLMKVGGNCVRHVMMRRVDGQQGIVPVTPACRCRCVSVWVLVDCWWVYEYRCSRCSLLSQHWEHLWFLTVEMSDDYKFALLLMVCPRWVWF